MRRKRALPAAGEWTGASATVVEAARRDGEKRGRRSDQGREVGARQAPELEPVHRVVGEEEELILAEGELCAVDDVAPARVLQLSVPVSVPFDTQGSRP